MKKYKWLIAGIVVLLLAALWFWKFRNREAPVMISTEKPAYGFIANAITATAVSYTHLTLPTKRIV